MIRPDRRPIFVLDEQIHLARGLKDVCLSAYGPHGRPKAVHVNPKSNSVHVTSISSRLFGYFSIKAPIVRLLVQLVDGHRESVGDGGLFAMALAAGLIERGWSSGHPIPLVVQSYRMALTWTVDLMDQITTKVSWGDMRAMLELVKSSFTARAVTRLSEQTTHFLAVLLVQAFLTGLEINPKTGLVAVPSVRVLSLVGKDTMASEVLDGVIVDIPLPIGAPRSLSKVRTVLYNVNLDLSANEQYSENMHVKIAAVASSPLPDSARDWTTTEASKTLMHQLADTWTKLGVGLVASQKRIHPYLLHLLITRGIVPLQRLSIRHIQAVHAAIGGKLLGSVRVEALKQEGVLGTLERMDERILSGKRHLYFTKKTTRMSTLVAYSCDKQAADELQEQIEGSLRTLKHFLSTNSVLPGGGCFESIASAYLRARLRERWPMGSSDAIVSGASSSLGINDQKLVRMMGSSVMDFVRCLEDFVVAVAPSSPSSSSACSSSSSDSQIEDSLCFTALPSILSNFPQHHSVQHLYDCHSISDSTSSERIARVAEHSSYYGWVEGHSSPQPVLKGVSAAGGASRDNKKLEISGTSVLDASFVKRKALQQAVEAACIVLRVDNVFAHTRRSVE